MSYKTDLSRVAGLGSAKRGVEHFVSQRVSAIALIVLVPLFLYTFIGALGEGYTAVLETYSRPLPALIAIMFMVTVFRHLRLGMQVVLEDYVSNHRLLLKCLIVNMLIWRAAAIVGVFAVAKIAFSA